MKLRHVISLSASVILLSAGTGRVAAQQKPDLDFDVSVANPAYAPSHPRVVIDEAHNFCPPSPHSSIEAQLTEQLIQIAAEGRKFGLWLFLSSQRPTKIHPNVLSQCDNLGLMRMNAPRDLAELAGRARV